MFYGMFYGTEKYCKIKLAFGAFGKGDFRDRKKHEKVLIEEGRIDAKGINIWRGGGGSQTRRPKTTPKKAYKVCTDKIPGGAAKYHRHNNNAKTRSNIPCYTRKKIPSFPNPQNSLPASSSSSFLHWDGSLFASLGMPCLPSPFIFQLGKYRMTKDRRDQKNPPPSSLGRAFKERGEEIMIGEGFEGRAELVHTE